MLKRIHQQQLIHPADIPPSQEGMEVIGAFNPGVIEHEGDVMLLVRIAERPCEQRDGFIPLPRWSEGRIVTDWVSSNSVEQLDSRVVRDKVTGLLRLTFTSHLRLVRICDGQDLQIEPKPTIFPCMLWEEFGIEDPRIVRIENRYVITYVAVSRHGASTAIISTDNFKTFERHGMIFCPENKDVVLFPQKIHGQYVALHRPTTAHTFCRPEIWLARSPDLIHWGEHEPLHGGQADWEADRVGAGAPPILTDAGWLEIYHASRKSPRTGEVGTYTAGALLLDLENPSRVLARSQSPLWEPDQDYELQGFVPGVVFPTGIIKRGDVLQVYYGAADTSTGLIKLSETETLKYLN